MIKIIMKIYLLLKKRFKITSVTYLECTKCTRDCRFSEERLWVLVMTKVYERIIITIITKALKNGI